MHMKSGGKDFFSRILACNGARELGCTDDGNSDVFGCELNSVVEEIEDYARSKVK